MTECWFKRPEPQWYDWQPLLCKRKKKKKYITARSAGNWINSFIKMLSPKCYPQTSSNPSHSTGLMILQMWSSLWVTFKSALVNSTLNEFTPKSCRRTNTPENLWIAPTQGKKSVQRNLNMRKQPLENETTLILHMHGSAHNPEQYQFLSLYIFNPLYTTDFLTGCTALCYHHPLCQKITHRKQPSLTGPPHTHFPPAPG